MLVNELLDDVEPIQPSSSLIIRFGDINIKSKDVRVFASAQDEGVVAFREVVHAGLGAGLLPALRESGQPFPLGPSSDTDPSACIAQVLQLASFC